MRVVKFLLVAFVSVSLGATYYVSPDGSDSWDGSAAHPWATPGYGSKHIAPGDTLIILPGEYVMSVYWDDMITPPSGSPGAPTVIMGEGYPPPKMMGTGSLFSCVQISDGSHIVIKNLELTSLIDTPYSGGCREGIDATSDVSDLTFEDLIIHRVEEMGINLGGDAQNIVIRRCNIHHCGYTAIGGPAPSGDGWVDVLIDSCYLGYCGRFYHGRDTVAWVWDRPDGLGMEPSEGPLEVRYTISEYNMGDGLDSKSRRTYIHHCIVANNFADGVKLWGDSSRVENTLVYGTGAGFDETTPWCLLVIDCEDSGAHFEVINCTFWDSPDRPPHYLGTVQYDTHAPISLVLRNNIFAAQRALFLDDAVNLVCDHNLFDIRDAVQLHWRDTYTCANIGDLGAGNFCDSPEFVDEPAWGDTGDFHLAEGSPGIDAGASVSLSDDLDGTSRPQGSGYDIGCYERSESTGIKETPSCENYREPTARFVPGRGVLVNSFGRTEVTIVALDGKVLKTAEGTGEFVVDFDPPAGVYLVRMKIAGKTTAEKIVVIK